MLENNLYNVRVPGSCGNVEECLVILVLGVHQGPGLHQEVDHLAVPLLRGDHQRSPAVNIPQVQVRFPVNQ